MHRRGGIKLAAELVPLVMADFVKRLASRRAGHPATAITPPPRLREEPAPRSSRATRQERF
ncbi:MAG: hypothetical protein ACO3JG_13905 [Luteolibacter sp.]